VLTRPGHELKLGHRICGQIRPIGDPNCPVLQRVDGVLVLDGLVVDATILPRRAVVAASRRVRL
jgi:hypothetical protein